MTTAWIFPGQGSQKLGMADSVMSLPGSKDRFELASQILDRDLFEICNGTSSETEELNDLNNTRNTQPALFVIESLLADELHRQGKTPSFLAGHSLGEIVALYSGGVIDDKTALKLLKSRSELMASAKSGGMTAVIGFDREELEQLVAKSEGVVIANDNSAAQVVLSGSKDALANISNDLKCKRAIPLKVSGAFHSPLMELPSEKFSKELDSCNFQDSKIPIISNSDPNPTCDAKLLKLRLKSQMTKGVRWRETMQFMVNAGTNTFLEIGPGNVLGGLLKRSYSEVSIKQLSNSSDLGY